MRRLASLQRASSGTTKLLNPDLLADMRSTCKLYRFDNVQGITQDVSYLKPEAAADSLRKKIITVFDELCKLQEEESRERPFSPTVVPPRLLAQPATQSLPQISQSSPSITHTPSFPSAHSLFSTLNGTSHSAIPTLKYASKKGQPVTNSHANTHT